MAPKRPPNRTTDASLYVRCSADEKRLMEQAAAVEAESLPAGARLPVTGWALGVLLARAKALVEQKGGKRGNGR